MRTLILLFILILQGVSGMCQTLSAYMHVDQFGYELNQEKIAVISNPIEGYNANENYTPPFTFFVIKADNGQNVYSVSPEPWNNGNTHAQSGDQGWWVDFSNINEAGNYYLLDDDQNLRSPIFTISPDPYKEVMKQAGRMFFYNRCNAPKAAPFAETKWVDADNFKHPGQDLEARYIFEPDNAALERDVSGGWFDAGDYNKYVSFTYTTLHNLLTAYEANPTAFSDQWNIPESGNNIPDVIDEIVWELQWLERMQNADGSVHNKAGSKNHSENVSSPPSTNTDPRYYGATCTSASATVASVFAHASIVLEGFPVYQTYAQELRQKAILSFNQVLPFYQNNTLEEDCDDGSIVAGDADQDAQHQTNLLIDAAIYLFEGTGEASFQSFLKNNYQEASLFKNNYFNHYDVNLVDVLLRYTNLTTADDEIKNAILNLINTGRSNNNERLFGFHSEDLYRSYMPDYSYHWGSNNAKASLGNLNIALAEIADAADRTSYLKKAKEQLHYFHGVNPLGMVYLSNMNAYGADRSINEIYHIWFADGTEYDHAQNSLKGPAPAYVAGGPNKDYSYTGLTPPFGQPAQKAYLDFNTSWPESSWEITEPAIYYQAAYIRLLSNFITNENVVSTEEIPANTASVFQAFPNPTSNLVYLSNNKGISNFEVHLYNAVGKLVLQAQSPEVIGFTHLPAGMYTLMINSGTNSSEIHRILKE